MGRGDSARKRDGQSIAYLLPNISDAVSIAVGTSGAFGAKTAIIPKNNDYEHLAPIQVAADVGAVTAETVTVRLTATDEDGGTKSVSKTTTADALIEFTGKDIAAISNGIKRLVKLEIDAHTGDAAAGPTVDLSAHILDYP